MWLLHLLYMHILYALQANVSLLIAKASQTQSKPSLVKELGRASWQQCSSAKCQTPTPAAPLVLAFAPATSTAAQVPQTACTWTPWSCAFGMAAVFPPLAKFG